MGFNHKIIQFSRDAIVLSKVCEDILDHCCSKTVERYGKNSCDNMTVIIIWLEHTQKPSYYSSTHAKCGHARSDHHHHKHSSDSSQPSGDRSDRSSHMSSDPHQGGSYSSHKSHDSHQRGSGGDYRPYKQPQQQSEYITQVSSDHEVTGGPKVWHRRECSGSSTSGHHSKSDTASSVVSRWD